MGVGFIPGTTTMAVASRVSLGQRGSRSQGRRRRKKSRAKGRARATKRTRGGSKGRKMKFGSPAWQKKYKVGKFAKRRRR